MQRIDVRQGEHIRAAIAGGEAGARTAIAGAQRRRLCAALDQPRELLARITADPLQKAQHHGFLGTLEPPVGEAPHGAADKAVPLGRSQSEIHRVRAVQKGLQLRQGL